MASSLWHLRQVNVNVDRDGLRYEAHSRATLPSAPIASQLLLSFLFFHFTSCAVTAVLTFISFLLQMYTFFFPNCSSEMETAASIIHWLHANLESSIHEYQSSQRDAIVASPDWSSFILAGHSRGGKVAYGVALGLAGPLGVPLKALLAFDPVDGMSEKAQLPPPILSWKPNSLSIPAPQLVLASGLGPEKLNPFFPPCAPRKVGPHHFFSDSSGPAILFSIRDQGHTDFDNDDLGLMELFTKVCKNGAKRGPMRDTAGGLAVAFLNFVALQQSEDLAFACEHYHIAPAVMEKPELNPQGWFTPSSKSSSSGQVKAETCIQEAVASTVSPL